MPSNKVTVRFYLRVRPRPVFTPSLPRSTSRSVATGSSVPLGLIIGGVGAGVVLLLIILGAISGGGSGDQVQGQPIAPVVSNTGVGAQVPAPTQRVVSTQPPATSTRPPQPTSTPVPVIGPIIPMKIGDTRVDTLVSVGSQNRYSYTAGGLVTVKVVPESSNMNVNIITTLTSGETSRTMSPGCYVNPWVSASAGYNLGSYMFTVFSQCTDEKAIGSYRITFYKYGDPNSGY